MQVEKYFVNKEFLASVIPNYRLRDTQLEAAKFISDALASYDNALLEAPTGSGKSMAYLIPAIDSGKKVIISTKTKQLMNQLLYKDLPTIQGLISNSYTIAELKGRKNYLCLYRFYKYVMPNIAYYSDVIEWFEGIKDDIVLIPYTKFDYELCNLMSADRYQCSYSKCNFYDECSFYKAKDLANVSDMIITNHHLLLSDMALKMKDGITGIFDFRDHIIFDEAHSLPDIFIQYAGAELSLFSILLFMRENKLSLSIETIAFIEDAYFNIIKKIDQYGDKFKYDKIQPDIASFLSLGERIVSDTSDDELIEGYNRYLSQLNIIDSDLEGLRYVEHNNHRLTVKFAPFSIKDTFYTSLQKVAASSVFVSATLSVAGEFTYFIKETGIRPDTKSLMLKSIFDYKKQGRLFITDGYNKKQKEATYIELAASSNGSILIIVNSIDQMQNIYELLKSTIKNKKIISQRELILSELDFNEDIVLIGVAILREGIDLSRGNFKIVIIDKLPFEYPNDLYLSSKADKIEEDGGNRFRDFFLPRAVIYFNQAIGRLIRHEDDKGVWVIFDDRVVTKSYGKYFITTLSEVDRLNSVSDVIGFVS